MTNILPTPFHRCLLEPADRKQSSTTSFLLKIKNNLSLRRQPPLLHENDVWMQRMWSALRWRLCNSTVSWGLLKIEKQETITPNLLSVNVFFSLDNKTEYLLLQLYTKHEPIEVRACCIFELLLISFSYLILVILSQLTLTMVCWFIFCFKVFSQIRRLTVKNNIYISILSLNYPLLLFLLPSTLFWTSWLL